MQSENLKRIEILFNRDLIFLKRKKKIVRNKVWKYKLEGWKQYLIVKSIKNRQNERGGEKVEKGKKNNINEKQLGKKENKKRR